MAENRRYYWLKLKEDFFIDKRIKRLRRISGGDTYTIIYLKLLLLSLKDSVEVIIFSDNVRHKDMLTRNILHDFIRDYPTINVKMKIAGKKYHDRYIAIDYGTEHEAFYLCGASSKDAGNKISSITKIEESSKDMYHMMFSGMLSNKDLKV